MVSSTPIPIRIAPTIVLAGSTPIPTQPIRPSSAMTGSVLATIEQGASAP
jgi:hypothetical protein